ncbi:peptidoglycan DD-metalloendopeptidase family protein [Turicibacter sp. TJ11]|uniref:peptidoglycan DD-metalloendopeptidase family protein n=1 Tax=Turicibacter sp. TJ11 TaxID=2806443 RepID=UPI001F39E038|nr:M23 family metallopeptidase [Turicibacter sp. TJ11]
MKKNIIGAVLATLMFTGNHIKVAEASTLISPNVVYRVYINDEVIGLITDESDYEKLIEKRTEVLSKQYPNQEIKAPTNVRIEEEVTLLPIETIDSESVLKTIEQKANFEASTQQVTIGDKTFSVEDANVVSNTMLELMTYYTGEEDLKKIMNVETSIVPLMESGSQYVGAKIVEPVKVETTYVSPEQILTPEQTRRMMLYGQAEPKETVIFDEDSSLWYIANDHGLTEEELILLNPEVEGLKWADLLGMELDVTPLNPIVTVETEKETVNVSAIAYETEYIDDDTMLKGQTTIKQEGKDGEHLERTQVFYENGTKVSSELVEETTVSEPVNEIIIRGTKVVSGVGSGNWVWPTTTRNVTCGYLCYSGHYAIDISAYVGQPVYAADSGVIVSAGYSSGYGYNILINHKNGYYTRYAHLSSLNVSSGQTVEAGQTIGLAGNTGNSTGPHLHFEIRTNTGSQPSYAPNPLDFY